MAIIPIVMIGVIVASIIAFDLLAREHHRTETEARTERIAAGEHTPMKPVQKVLRTKPPERPKPSTALMRTTTLHIAEPVERHSVRQEEPADPEARRQAILLRQLEQKTDQLRAELATTQAVNQELSGQIQRIRQAPSANVRAEVIAVLDQLTDGSKGIDTESIYAAIAITHPEITADQVREAILDGLAFDEIESQWDPRQGRTVFKLEQRNQED